ncbi:hypothetical protein ACWPM1_00490 [Tsuneonella sp. HG249]
MRRALFVRLWVALIAAVALAWSPAAVAKVSVSFHSFNGSALFGRFPHTFIVLHGTEEATGRSVNENYGFTAKTVSPAVLNGPVVHAIMTEKAKYITSTNRHFTIELSDAEYHAIVKEVARWRDAPGKYYDLDTRNCIHFVGRMAELAGLKVDYPKELLRKPKAWLNRVSKLNPQLGAKQL